MRSAVLSLLILASSVRAADWQPVATELLAREKTGFGGLCGVVADHATGRLFVNLSDRGVFTSADRGKTWERLGKEPFKGRNEDPGCFLLDPTGKTKKLLLPLVYGVPLTFGTADKGEWRTVEKSAVHIDWCAADWTDPDMKFLLVLKHEANGQMLRSMDGGKSWDDLGKGFGPAWVFDGKTAVAAKLKTKDNPKGGIVRTTDGGATWKPAAEFTPNPIALPRWNDQSLYWLADGALHVTSDSGATWEKVGAVKEPIYGPVFGKSAKQLFVLTKAGIVESADGGKTWGMPIPAPKDMKGIAGLVWVDYDPSSDTLYMMKMGSDLYRLQR
jgi:photosystem II stability/assembly factor-like uncharacterized protein